jgi:hypothetical protein
MILGFRASNVGGKQQATLHIVTALLAETGLKSGTLYPIIMRLPSADCWTLPGGRGRRSVDHLATCTS